MLAETSSAGAIVGAIVVVALIVAGVVLYLKNEKFKDAVESIISPRGTQSKWQIRKVTEGEMTAIMGSIAAIVTRDGYVPQSQSGNLYTYQKQEMQRPSAIIAIILFFFCIIPMIIYLARGHKMTTYIVTVQIAENPGGYLFNVKGPGNIKRKIKKIIEPYLPLAEAAV